MSNAKVIDADGHIIERTEELRKYLKPPFNKRGGPLTASEPGTAISSNPAARPAHLSQRAYRAGLAATFGRSQY